MSWLQIIVQGGLLGGIYALFAIGLSLSFGIMRLVNIAHGDLIVLSAYVALVVGQATGLDPITCLIIVVPVMFLVGYALQRGLLNQTLSGGLLPPLLGSFGISIIIHNWLAPGIRRLHAPSAGRRDRDRKPAIPGWHHHRRLPAPGLRRGAARARQLAAIVLSDRIGAGVSRGV